MNVIQKGTDEHPVKIERWAVILTRTDGMSYRNRMTDCYVKKVYQEIIFKGEHGLSI